MEPAGICLCQSQRRTSWCVETGAETKKGYYMAHIYEGINPVTGFKYRRYTMIRYRRE